MSTTFTCSLRSLDADSFRRPLWGLLLLILFLVLWGGWFFFARLPVYEVAPAARLEDAGLSNHLTLAADFPPAAALGRIRPGQPAWLQLDGFPSPEYPKLSVSVTKIDSQIQAGYVRVELSLPPDLASPLPLQPGLTGTVEVEVERISPATLILRAIGQDLSPRESQP